MQAICGGTILTPEERINEGAILIDQGKIVAVGKDVGLPDGVDVIDATGCTIVPGFIEAHCHVSLFADGIDPRFFDGNEMTDPITPHVRAIDAVHPEDLAFPDLRAAGITTINTSPGSANVIGGQTAVLKTAGRTIDEMVIKAPGAVKMALGENPKRVYGEQKKLPSTRMGSAAILREWLAKARIYLEKRERYEQDLALYNRGFEGATRPAPFDTDLRLEILGQLLRRELQAHIHAHRADDIMTAVRIAEEFELDYVLIHATEGYKIADVIAEKGAPCICGPILFSRMKLELREMTPANAAVLSKAGVKLAIQTDEASATKYLTLNAAVAVREGMDESEALRAITRTAAEILGVDDRVGSIEPGKDADLVILSTHPLDIAHCHVERVLIDGETVYTRDSLS